MARIDPNDPRPPYLQIASDLRQAITAGSLAPGGKLDSSRDLAASYGVAPMTVHQAIRVLREEGLVNSFQGRGVFVRTAHDEVQPSDLPAQLEEVRRRVDGLSANMPTDLAKEVTDLRRQVGLLQAQLIDLYARTGHSYPHDQTSASSATGSGTRQRKASGA